MKKILTTALLAAMMLSSLQAESYAQKEKLCYKTYIDSHAICNVFGEKMCRNAVVSNWQKIKYYCPSTHPAYYNEFKDAMRKMGKL